jgi:fermentation-respiration switch protein FrsA (DUF1100 family)
VKKRYLFSGGALAAVAGLGVYMTNQIMYMQKKEEAFILEREIKAKRFVQKDFDSLPKSDVLIPSMHGYSIHATFIKPFHTNKFIIFSHGVTENRFNSVKYMNLFLSRGFNAVIYDHRRHGGTGGKTTSYGFYEKDDLKAVVNTLIKREGEDVFFGIHGESMGAATMLLYAGLVEDRADFYISDCSFSNFRDLLSYRMKQDFKVESKWVLSLADVFVKIRDGYSIRNVAPIDAVEHIKKPILFIHSQNDEYILPSMTQALFDHKKGDKMLYLAPFGGHAMSLVENPEEYEAQLDGFLNKFVKVEQANQSVLI